MTPKDLLRHGMQGASKDLIAQAILDVLSPGQAHDLAYKIASLVFEHRAEEVAAAFDSRYVFREADPEPDFATSSHEVIRAWRKRRDAVSHACEAAVARKDAAWERLDVFHKMHAEERHG